MKAVFLHAYGGVEQLQYGDAPDPVPADDQILVRVAGTSINPIDWKVRNGYMKEVMPLQLPAILGRDVAGEVVSVGAKVKRFKAGDTVLGLVNHSYAELLLAKEEELALIPKGLAFDQAAVIPLVTITGAQLAEKGVKAKGGEVILITGALGPVGRTAVYVAKVHGAIVVAGVRAAQVQQAHGLGADKVIDLESDRDLKALEMLDGIADTVGGATLARMMPKLKEGGKLGTVVGKPALVRPDIKLTEVFSQPDSKRLAALAEDVRVGDLVIPIGLCFKLPDIREAQSTAEGGVAGKVLITPN